MSGALPPDQSRWFMEEVHPHESALRAYLRSKFPWSADIDDLVQESFARLWRRRETGRPGSGKALLFTTARHVAIDLFRRRETVAIDYGANYEHLPVAEPGPADALCRQQEIELLTAAIAQLPARCRQVLTLRKIYGLSHREIGAHLGISEHTVEAQVTRGMRGCMAYLRRCGVTGRERS